MIHVTRSMLCIPHFNSFLPPLVYGKMSGGECTYSVSTHPQAWGTILSRVSFDLLYAVIVLNKPVLVLFFSHVFWISGLIKCFNFSSLIMW